MEIKQTCRCGKEFPSIRSLSNHRRYCSGKDGEGGELTNRDLSDAGTSSNEIAKNQAGTSTEPNGGEFRDAEDDVSTGAESISISYRCVKCSATFPTVEAYRQHYLALHLNVDVGSTVEPGRTTVLPEGGDDVQHREPAPVEKKEKSPQPRSYCKRCRVRILSSSEDEESSIDQPLNKSKIKKKSGLRILEDHAEHEISPEPAGASADNVAVTLEFTDANVSSTTDAVSSKKLNCMSPAQTSAVASNILNETGDDVGTEPRQALSDSSHASNNTAGYEVVKELLKDADAVTKPEKVIILNFFSGHRVNPRPDKGPISIIRLGEKTDTITLDDGSKQTVLRESYVKLNYDTGKWDKIDKTKQLRSEASASSA